MNLRDLQYLVAVADLRNFSQAAEQCFVSQPTLSNQIKKLEETLGVTLFERTNKRVMTTETGEQIVALARRVLREVEEMHDVAQSAQDPLAGKFRLGAFPTLSTYLFPSLVPAISSAMPMLKLVLVEDKTQALIDRLKRGELDAALLALPIHDDQLHVEPLFQDPFMLAVSPQHPLASNQEVSQNELTDHRLLLLEEGHCLRDQALEVCHLHNIAEDQDFRATSLETLRLMVKAGSGITFMPKIACQYDTQDICYLPFRQPAPYRTIALVWRRTSTRRAIFEQLLHLLKPKS